MLIHIVLFKIPNLTPELAEQVAEKFNTMRPQIDEIRHFELGRNVVMSDRAYDFALYSHFDSLETMQAYQVHPAHQELVAYLRSIDVKAVAVDYLK